MRKSGDEFRTIWQKPGDPAIVQIIDQRRLPHEYVVVDLVRWQDGATAISDMLVRGAPLIGATAAWSLYLAALEADGRPDTRDCLAQAGHVRFPAPIKLRQRPGTCEKIPLGIAWHLSPIDAANILAPSDDLTDEPLSCIQRYAA